MTGVVAKYATRGIAPGDRLRYWNAVAEDAFRGTSVQAESQVFEGEMLCWSLGQMAMIRTRSIAASVLRRALYGDEERVIMHVQWRGSGRHYQAGHETRLEVGDFVIGSPHENYRFELSPHEMMVVEFPHHELARRVPDLNDRMARRICGTTPAARVFNDFLHSMWRQADTAEGGPDWESGINRVFYDLAAMAIQGDNRDGDHTANRGQRWRAYALIESCLSDPDLCTNTIARELGTSARTVQNIFAEMGTTPSAAILDRRLERAAEKLLADPTLSITEAAFSHGFNDSAYFTRCFRQKFGVSPRAWRIGHTTRP